MMPGFELLLPLGALGFYLYDCAHLLYGNELLLAHRNGRWSVMRRTGLALFGRELVFGAPFTPHATLYRVHWSEHDARRRHEDPVALSRFETGLAPLRPLVLTLLLLLGVALPVASLGYGAGLALLGVFALYYVLVVVALLLLARRREALGLARREFWATAFDVLACAPFAVNLLHRLSLQHGLAGDPLAFARQHFDAASLAALRAAVAGAVAPALAASVPGSDERAALESLLARLEVAA